MQLYFLAFCNILNIFTKESKQFTDTKNIVKEGFTYNLSDFLNPSVIHTSKVHLRDILLSLTFFIENCYI